MSETGETAAAVAAMLRLVPAAVPGAVSLQRDRGSLWPNYSLQYLKSRGAHSIAEAPPPGVEAVRIPIAAAWSVHFLVGIMLLLVGMVVAVLLPPATHDRSLALVAIIFVVLGFGALWRSRFTPVEPDRLSLANAVIRARLAALSVDADDRSEIAKTLTNERQIIDLLTCLALPSRNTRPRSWPAAWARADDSPSDDDRDPA